jgi:hypothetical protein
VKENLIDWLVKVLRETQTEDEKKVLAAEREKLAKERA